MGSHVTAGINQCYAVNNSAIENQWYATVVDARDPVNPESIILPVDLPLSEIYLKNHLMYAVDAEGLKIFDISGIVFTPHTCSVFTEYEPALDVEVHVEAIQTNTAFSYSPSADASTDVSFELHVNGYHVATSHLKKVFWPNLCVGSQFQILDILEYACGLKPRSALILNQNPFFEMACNVQGVLPSETDRLVAMPDNLIAVGENVIELKNPVCTIGYGSCEEGIVSWGGTACITDRESEKLLWFESEEAPLDISLSFEAQNQDYSLSVRPGPRICTAVTFNIYRNGDLVAENYVLPIAEDSQQLSIHLTEGENIVEFRQPQFTPGEGCCPADGQITSWAGMLILAE